MRCNTHISIPVQVQEAPILLFYVQLVQVCIKLIMYVTVLLKYVQVVQVQAVQVQIKAPINMHILVPYVEYTDFLCSSYQLLQAKAYT